MKTLSPSLLLLCCLTACHRGGTAEADGGEYTVHATLATDSTVVTDHLVLYADSHAALRGDSLSLSPDRTVSARLTTQGLDEVYLCADCGELCRLYATGGMDVRLRVSGGADSLVVGFEPTDTDSINPWLARQRRELATLTADGRRRVIDSLCHLMPADVRCALLLRDEAVALADSVAVRRCLGALSAEAKPDWLVRGIEDLLDATSDHLARARRLAPARFELNDSTVYDMGTNRSDYLLVYCWAEHDAASVDSLRMLARLVSDEYDTRRLTLMTCCLGAADSTAWRQHVRDLDGLHFWLPAGLADQRVRRWGVERVPMVMVCDMYNNQQRRDVWGRELRDALDRVPRRSGFAHTPRTMPHGR